MIASIRGTLQSASTGSVVIEAGGVGYLIFISTEHFHSLPSLGEEALVHTSFVIRENSQALYGFMNVQQRELFEVLLGVSGIGPKTGLALIGSIAPDDFQRAIQQQDIALICKVPGIGKKTAERLIIEVRDKLPGLTLKEIESTSIQEGPNPASQKMRDAMSALINLGYTQGLALQALKRSIAEEGDDVELPQLITSALKNL